MRAFDVATGLAAWNHVEPGFNPSSPPVVHAGALYLSGSGGSGADYGQILSLDAATGARRWIVDGSQTQTPPLVVDGVGLQTRRSSASLTAFSLVTGATIWNDSAAQTPPVGSGTLVFYSVSDSSGWRLVAREASTGTVLWEWPLPSGQRVRSLVADASRVFARVGFQDGNLLGRVVAFDRGSGAVIWNNSAANLYDEKIVRLGKSVLTLGFSGGAAYDPATGTPQLLGAGFYWVEHAAYADSTFYLARQRAGEANYVIEAFRDMAAPQLAATAPVADLATTDTRPTFTWSVDDGAGVGVADVQIVLGGGAPVSLGASSGAYQPAPLADGAWTWSFRGVDAVGNTVTTADRTIEVDTTAPQAFAPWSPAALSSIVQVRPAFEWAPATDVTSGVVRYEVVVDGALTASLGEASCPTDPCRFISPEPLTDGLHRWTVTAIDRVGNSRTADGGTFAVAAPPSGTLQVASLVHTGEDVLLAAAFVDPNGSVAAYAWDLDGDGTFETNSGVAPNVTSRYATIGTRTVQVRATDSSGLVGVASAAVTARAGPPVGELGMSINNGEIATNSRDVELTVVWPRFTTDALISNDGGFGAAGAAASLPITQTLNWTLASSGPERLPKTVYLRFRGDETGRETYTDDIILDERPPSIQSVVAAPIVGATSVRVAKAHAIKLPMRTFIVRATDENSGIAAIQVSARRSLSGSMTKLVVDPSKRGSRAFSGRVRLRAPRGRVFVRVLDSAGNASAWRRTR